MLNNFIEKGNSQQMKHNIPMAFLFALIGLIGIIVTRIGIKQKREGDVMIGILMTIVAMLIYFIEFF